MATLQRLEEFANTAGTIRYPAASDKKPVDYAVRFLKQRELPRLNAFLSEGKMRSVAPDQNAVQKNFALQFAKSVGADITYQARKERAAPAQAVAFDKLAPQEALKHFPELEGAYKLLAKAKQLADRMPNEEDRKRFMDVSRKRISAELHQGKEVSASEKDKGRSH